MSDVGVSARAYRRYEPGEDFVWDEPVKVEEAERRGYVFQEAYCIVRC